MTRALRIAAAAALTIAGLAAVGCGDDDSSTTASDTTTTATTGGGGEALEIKMGDFYFDPKNATAKAGTVAISAPNVGDVEHELVLAKTNDDPAKLPTASDGTVDEESLDIPGEIAEVAAGKTGEGAFDLEAAKYVMFCNLPGHYAQGMYGSLTVE